MKTEVEFNEQEVLPEEETNEQTNDTLAEDDEFKKLVYERMRKIHNEGMVVGLQTACHTILDIVYSFERRAGKKSANDYKRLIKDVKRFCEVGTSSNKNSNSDTENAEETTSETVQN